MSVPAKECSNSGARMISLTLTTTVFSVAGTFGIVVALSFLTVPLKIKLDCEARLSALELFTMLSPYTLASHYSTAPSVQQRRFGRQRGRQTFSWRPTAIIL